MEPKIAYKPVSELGAGVMPWEEHVKALQAMWILKYRDATRGAWKSVLDVWLDREQEGRGLVLSTIKPSELTKSTTNIEPSLPRFWKDALTAIRELGCTPVDENTTTRDDARAHPIWYSPMIELPHTRMEVWYKEKLQLRTLKDMIKDEENRPYNPTRTYHG